jgi:hypothetical protein
MTEQDNKNKEKPGDVQPEISQDVTSIAAATGLPIRPDLTPQSQFDIEVQNN